MEQQKPTPATQMRSNIQWTIDICKEAIPGFDAGALSDGYHTFSELYDFRKVYNAALFNEWAALNKYDVHKATRHYGDTTPCFGGGWFIVVAILPTGQISNHYEMKDWDLFKVPAVDEAKYQFDFHTPQDVIERLHNLLAHEATEEQSAGQDG